MTGDPSVKHKKSLEQQAAWNELLLLTADAEWYKDSEKSKRHKVLMAIIEPFSNVPEKELTVDEKKQRYLDMRPGLEDCLVAMLRANKTNAEMIQTHKVNSGVFVYLRRKHGFKCKEKTKRHKD